MLSDFIFAYNMAKKEKNKNKMRAIENRMQKLGMDPATFRFLAKEYAKEEGASIG